MSTPSGQMPRLAQSALLVDFYELTMMSAYYELGMEKKAAFEFYVRNMPSQRNFLVAAGLEQALDFLESLRFSAEDIAWLGETGKFKRSFLERLAQFRFTGEVFAMREGTVFFEEEPILRIEAPLPEAQFLESRLMNILHLQTLIASKAVRCRIAARNRHLVDFGLRRAHGAEAALFASRASYIAGFDATSNVQAGRMFGIPVSGTMAHSFVQAHERERDAFLAFAHCRHDDLTLLIDTYDIRRGALRVVELNRVLEKEGIKIRSVRIDSGDLGEESRKVRKILDEGNCPNIGIFASSGVHENMIAQLLSNGAPIDGFGVGTAMTVSADLPALDCVYKLQEYAGTPRSKRSLYKKTLPGSRQVHRLYNDHGRIAMDTVTDVDDSAEGKLLLQRVMSGGRRLSASPSLQEIRKHCAKELTTLPDIYLNLSAYSRSPVKISHGLRTLAGEFEKLEH